MSKAKPIWGVKKIAEVINHSPRPTYYLLEHGLLPGRKIGDRWVSEEAALLAAILPRDDDATEGSLARAAVKAETA